MPEVHHGGGLGRRLIWLASSVATGAALGTAGYVVSDSQYWFLAVPASMAAAWLFVGTPEQCRHEAPKGAGSPED